VIIHCCAVQVLNVIAAKPNICKSLHIPAQSGSTSVLERMRRGYTRESYLALIEKVKQTIPGNFPSIAV
jgi:tRNA A37 methylthiotransferase MiaB